MMTYDKYRELTEKNANRNQVIEECARVAEQYDSDALSWIEDGIKVIQSDVATAIRALKDKI